MNNLERFIYNKIRFSPKLKKVIIVLYQRILSLIPINKIRSKYQIVTREGYFYGFHDKCPWSNDNKLLLAHKINSDLKMPLPNDKIGIGFFEGEGFEKFNLISSTCTWNWQMGSMLQWIGNSEYIIFNDFDGKTHISKVIDKAGTFIRKYDKPIAAISPDGNYALSHSFIRLRKAAPAYGYANGNEESADENTTEKDGIYLLDLKTGKIELIFSISKIVNELGSEYSDNYYHYFTHCLFSHSGKRFAFFHRWVEKNNQTWTQLFTSNIDGTDIFKFDFSGVVTHLAWQDDEHLLAYGFKENIGDHYYLLKDQTNDFKIIGEQAFSSDGHPQFEHTKCKIITDTYPDRFRRQYLIQFDVNNNMRKNIAIVKSPLKFTGNVRCDLHPRWDRLGNHVSFDSAHTGKRALCTIRLHK